MYENKTFYVFGVIFIIVSSATLSNAIISPTDGYSNTEILSNPVISTQTLFAKWTVMYYMCGDSKSMEAYTNPLLENLSKIGSTSSLNIVALRDNYGQGDSRLYYINDSGEKIVLNEEFGWPNEVDTGNPNTLILFCSQMIKAYPSQHYALVIFAPGGTGWQRYPLTDMHGHRGPTLPAFGETLKKITNKVNRGIDVLFTSCVLGLIENAYEICPYVDYMVTTEEHISDSHIFLQRFYQATWDLKNDTSMTPEKFANRAPFRHKAHTFAYYEKTESPLTKILNKLPFPGLHTVVMNSSVSVVNLSKINALIEAVDDLASVLILNRNDENIKNIIKKAREEVREYGKAGQKFFAPFWPLIWLYSKFPLDIFAYDCFVDLYHLVELLNNNIQNNYIKYLCSMVMEKLNETIPAIKKVPDDPSYGLSIYFPSSKIMYNKYVLPGKIPCPYENLKFSKETSWDDFLRDYLNINLRCTKV